MIDAKEPGTPGWWMSKLMAEQHNRRIRLNRLDAYYRGRPDLPNVDTVTSVSFEAIMRKARANFAELIVEAVRERMRPVGFRTGGDDNELGDKEAWRIWQANSLDADSALVHRSSLSMSDAYVIVGPVSLETGAPVITPEDPRQVITAEDPVQRRRTIAALKVFHDDMLERDRAFVYLPGQVWKASRKARSTDALSYAGNYSSIAIGDWDWDGVEELEYPIVPVVRFANRASMMSEPMGEFESVIPALDRINHMILQRLVIATLQAFKQRAVKGVPTHDASGAEVDYRDVFSADPGAMWLLPDGAEIWESQQADLSGILLSVRHDLLDLAAATRTPLHIFTPDAANGSAEGASLSRESLVFKTEDRLTQAGESWEQVMSHAFLFAGDQRRASRGDMECLWAPPERFSMAERYDAASKASAAGVPWRSVMLNTLGFSPQEVERMEIERASDLALGASMQSLATDVNRPPVDEPEPGVAAAAS